MRYICHIMENQILKPKKLVLYTILGTLSSTIILLFLLYKSERFPFVRANNLDGGVAIPERTVNNMRQSFKWFYKSGMTNSNKDDISLYINPKIFFENIELSIDYILSDAARDNEAEGLNFEYILTNDNDGQGDYFNYLIYRGRRDGTALTNAKYYFIKRDSTLHEVPNLVNRNSLKESYTNNVKINCFSTYGSRNILDLKYNYKDDDALESCHPLRCFYSFKMLHYFFENNINYISHLEMEQRLFNKNVKIVLSNGAVFLPITEPHLDDYNLQTPIINFNINNKPHLGNEFKPDSPFCKMALDIGRLCPTECN